jgi:hypothetical protein
MHTIVQSKQSLKCQKFVQSGHPDLRWNLISMKEINLTNVTSGRLACASPRKKLSSFLIYFLDNKAEWQMAWHLGTYCSTRMRAYFDRLSTIWVCLIATLYKKIRFLMFSGIDIKATCFWKNSIDSTTPWTYKQTKLFSNALGYLLKILRYLLYFCNWLYTYIHNSE